MSKTLFIHIPKNGGTSVRNSDSVYPVKKEYLKSEFQFVYNNRPQWMNTAFIKHCPISYINRELLNRFDRTIAIVRNPWSRLVSLYYEADRITRILPNTEYANRSKISFDEFIDRIQFYKHNSDFYYNHPYDHFAMQTDWINNKVDILRFENLEEDFFKYFKKPLDKKDNVGSYKTSYQDHYDSRKINIVADWFANDIKTFNWDFDTTARKNYWNG